ncbi:MAG: hypothetical protein ACRCZJ_02875 [Erysipelotrichaceae bacterium]
MKTLALIVSLFAALCIGALGMYWYLDQTTQVEPCEVCPLCPVVQETLDKTNAIQDMYFQKVAIDASVSLEVVLQDFGLSQRSIIHPDSLAPYATHYAIIYGEEDIKNIELYTLDADILATLDYDFVQYMAQQEGVLLVDELQRDQVLVVDVVESEAVPVHLLRFERSDTVYYWVIQYDGKGDRKLIEDIYEAN